MYPGDHRAGEAGNKVVVAVGDGYRESTLSWKGFLLVLHRRGLKEGPRLSVADGGLGLCATLDEVFPRSREQQCWVYKTTNFLDKLPKSLLLKVKYHISDMYSAQSRQSPLGLPMATLCVSRRTNIPNSGPEVPQDRV